jgi:anti-sigma factor RsiW
VICAACDEECEEVDSDGNCPECAEHFANEDAMRDEESRQLAEYEEGDEES